MRSPAPGTLVVVAVVVVLVVVVCVPGVSATTKHHKGHSKGHHHHAKEPRAPRTRREQGTPGKETTATPQDGIPGTEPTTEVNLPCKGTGDNECEALANSECDVEQGVCECLKSHPVLDLENSYCGKVTMLNQPCKFTSECTANNEYSVCSAKKICDCGPGFELDELPEFGFNCIEANKSGGGGVDPAMIGVLAGLALMFIIICVVLRLFSKARFRENRSIFNTPNPRLMNASLFKDSGRRGSAMSAVSATGSTHGTTAPATAPKSPSPARETKKAETTVAIETVD